MRFSKLFLCLYPHHTPKAAAIIEPTAIITTVVDTPTLIPAPTLTALPPLKLDLIIDGGSCGTEPTTVIDFVEEGVPRLLREGKGDTTPFK